MPYRNGNKLTSVQIIRVNNNLALVQWTGNHDIPQRAWVAESNLVNRMGQIAEVDNPQAGVPYGVEIWRLVELKATSKDLDRELKNRGIWTVADLRARPNEVVGALTATYGLDVGALYQALGRYEKDLATEV